jgi:hypothetical protein
MKYLLTLTLLLTSLFSYSQLSGKITSDDEPTGQPVVTIRIGGTDKGTISDFDGNYKIDLENGEYDLIFSFVSYKTDTVHLVVNGETTYNHVMQSQSLELEGVSVVFKVNRESENILLTDRKKTTEVTQNIGSKELQKSGSSNVSEGLTKVTGISTQSNYIFIRGMGDRYNTSYLNSLPLPSIDPDSKMMPMDIFPTQIIKNLNVTKSYNPNTYGDVSGGSLDIRTKDYPNDFTLKVNLGTEGNTQTFRQFGSFDDVNFNPLQKSPINYNGNILIGNNFKKKDHNFGFLVNGYQKNKFTYEYGKIRTANAQGIERINYSYNDYQQRRDYSGLASLYYGYKEHSINFNSLFIQSNANSFRETDGYHFDYLDSIYTRRYTPTKRSLFVNQLMGTSKFNNFGIDWGVSYSKVKSTEDNRRQLVYLYRDGEYRINDIDILDNHRFSSYLNENELSTRLNLNYTLKKVRFDVGYDYKNKVRDFDYEQNIYNFTNPDLMNDINNPDLNLENNSDVIEVLNPASRYDASVSIHSTYLTFGYKSDKVTFNIGARMEKSSQLISYRDQQQPIYLRGNLIDSINILPSMNFKFDLTKKDILRFTTSKTLSRPGFREVAPFEYTEVFAGIKTIGNPNLRNSDNYNIDLRYERYNKSSDLIGVTIFGKYIDNPIEKTMLATASGQLQSFMNADYAYVYGLELEYKKVFILDSTSNIRLGTNLTLLKSLAKIDTTLGTIQTNTIRPLQGSSPVLFNLDMSYTKDWKNVESIVTLSYNICGPRLWSVGIQEMGDVYENTINTLNLTFRNTINDKWGINLSVKNILNPTYKTTQRMIDRTVVLNEYKRGINIGLGVSYNF